MKRDCHKVTLAHKPNTRQILYTVPVWLIYTLFCESYSTVNIQGGKEEEVEERRRRRRRRRRGER